MKTARAFAHEVWGIYCDGGKLGPPPGAVHCQGCDDCTKAVEAAVAAERARLNAACEMVFGDPDETSLVGRWKVEMQIAIAGGKPEYVDSEVRRRTGQPPTTKGRGT